MAKIAPTPTPTAVSASTSATASTMVMVGAKEKGTESEQEKQKEKQSNVEQVVAIESDAESDTCLMIDEPAKEILQQSAGTEQVMQSASANAGATPLAMGESTPNEVQGEEEVEMGVAMETSTAMQE